MFNIFKHYLYDDFPFKSICTIVQSWMVYHCIPIWRDGHQSIYIHIYTPNVSILIHITYTML
jgi:hypothetical protein